MANLIDSTEVNIGDKRRYLGLVTKDIGHDLYLIEVLNIKERACIKTPGLEYTLKILEIECDGSNRAVGSEFRVWRPKEVPNLLQFCFLKK